MPSAVLTQTEHASGSPTGQTDASHDFLHLGASRLHPTFVSWNQTLRPDFNMYIHGHLYHLQSG
jgi:hypothetical protein